MKERPILFSGPMVRALLDGSKTQTRRVVKPQPHVDALNNFIWNGWNFGQSAAGVPHVQSLASPVPWSKTKRVLCPFGAPGDRLWVRETFYCDNAFYPDGVGVDAMWRVVDGQCVAVPVEEQRAEMRAEDMYYRADGEPDFEAAEGKTPWRPSIHMPRWASRITLEVTGVRVERLHDITDADALAEGVDRTNTSIPGYARERFVRLWTSINGNESWTADPWVWVVEFKRVT